MKYFKNAFFLITTVSLLTVSSSCKKDEEEDPYKDVTVYFNVQAVDDAVINTAVTQVGVNQSSDFDVVGTSWSTEPQIVNTSVGALHVASTGLGADADSELIVKIFVDDELIASDTAKGGGNLLAKTYVNFVVGN